MRKSTVFRLQFVLTVLGFIGIASSRVEAQSSPAPAYVPGEILIKLRSDVDAKNVTTVFTANGLQSVEHFASLGVHRCRIAPGTDVAAAVSACRTDPSIAYAEPNYIYTASRVPSDPRFAELWGMQSGGDADLDAPEAWDTQTGSATVLVAVIDTGVDYTHEDLSANIWRNPGESGGGRETNRRDDDGNGFVDDVHGWDFAGNDNDPMDDNGHGSHVSGTIAAAGDNGIGVTGVSWQASIMALKFLSSSGSGSAADAIAAIAYASKQGARVLNNSWGGGGFSQALRDAIEQSRQANAVFVAAAGNEGRDNDGIPSYPASYDVANVLSVAAHDRLDVLASFSNFGKTSVDLAAPGAEILSTTPGNTYRVFSGTSMATPHTSGVAALVFAQYPQATYRQVLIRIAGSVEPVDAYANSTWSGGRLNAAAAIAPTPKVAFVTRVASSTGDVGPWTITAEALAETPVQDVQLGYTLQNGAPVLQPMQPATENAFSAVIPTQTLGTQVAYFVEAVDGAGVHARSRTYSFVVGGESAEIPGCGRFSLPAVKSTQTRAVVVLGNVLLILLALYAARRLRSHHTT